MKAAQQFSGAAQSEQSQELSCDCSQQPCKQQPRKLQSGTPRASSCPVLGMVGAGTWSQVLKRLLLKGHNPKCSLTMALLFLVSQSNKTLVSLQTSLPSAVEWQPRLPVSSSCTRITQDGALDKANKLQIKLFWKPQRNILKVLRNKTQTPFGGI